MARTNLMQCHAETLVKFCGSSDDTSLPVSENGGHCSTKSETVLVVADLIVRKLHHNYEELEARDIEAIETTIESNFEALRCVADHYTKNQHSDCGGALKEKKDTLCRLNDIVDCLGKEQTDLLSIKKVNSIAVVFKCTVEALKRLVDMQNHPHQILQNVVLNLLKVLLINERLDTLVIEISKLRLQTGDCISGWQSVVINLQTLEGKLAFVRKELVNKMYIDDSLLDSLESEGLLSVMGSERGMSCQVENLLNSMGEKTEPAIQKFMVWLKQNDQEHIYNYIIHCGKCAPSVGDCWPLEKKHCETIHRNKKVLIDCVLSVDDDFAFVLENKQCFTIPQMMVILRHREQLNARSRELLTVLLRSSISKYKVFIDCLQKNRQKHVAKLLTGGTKDIGDLSSQRLDESQLKRLTAHKCDIEQRMELEFGLIGELYSNYCIGFREMNRLHVHVKDDRWKANSHLLELIKRKNKADFIVFIDCLKKTKQKHLAHLLTENAAHARIHCQSNDPRTERIEEQIFRREELKFPIQETGDDEETSQMAQIAKSMHKNEVEFEQFHVFFSPTQSIECSFVCYTLGELNVLRSSFKSGKLQKLLTDIFTVLSSERVVLQWRFDWPESQYNSCEETLNYLGSDSDSSDEDDDEGEVESYRSAALSIEPETPRIIPPDLMKRILHRTVMLHKRKCTLTRKKAVEVLCSVCYIWWKTLMPRDYGECRPTLFLELVLLPACRRMLSIISKRWRCPLQPSHAQNVSIVVSDTFIVLSSVCEEWLSILSLRRVRKDLRQSLQRWNIRYDLLPNEMLPYELMEQILVKAAQMMHNKTLRDPLRPRRGHAKTFIVLSSICGDWSVILSQSRVQEKLRQSLQRWVPVPPVLWIKSAVYLRERYREDPNEDTGTTNRSKRALIQLASVSRAFWFSLAGSEVHRQKLKRAMHFYGGRLKLKSKRNVRSIAYVGNKLYGMTQWSTKIQVFDSTPPFSQLTDISVRGLKAPWDIAACASNGRLFISDYQSNCIFFVEPASAPPQQQRQLKNDTRYTPYTLSVTSNRLVVTSRDGKSVYVYDAGSTDLGEPLQTVSMPDGVKVLHAVLDQSGNCIACVERAVGETIVHNICKFSATSGEQTECLYDEQQRIVLNNPRHLVLCANDRVIVADSENNRVVLFDTNLNFIRILAEGKLLDDLYALCFVPESNQLIVGTLSSGVLVYYLKPRHLGKRVTELSSWPSNADVVVDVSEKSLKTAQSE